MKNDYFLGLDIGTNSVGYAVTSDDEIYSLKKYKNSPMWGVALFEEAKLKAERRAFRTARRRLGRRQQRIRLIQEMFAPEIAKKDSNFFRRIKESSLYREDSNEKFSLFADPDFTDKEYNEKYPTIHHLICDLIENTKPHDVRLIYIACAWLVAHRGHFLSEISEDNIDAESDFSLKYEDLMKYFENVSLDGEYIAPWGDPDMDKLEEAVKEKCTVTAKRKRLIDILLNGKAPSKHIEAPENFPFSVDGIIRLICGGTVSIKDLYGKEEYAEQGSFSLGKSQEEYDALLGELGDDGELLIKLRAIYDWAILCDIRRGEQFISKAKTAVYEQHRRDLSFLKYFIKKYGNDGLYDEVFRNINNDKNYVRYSGNIKSASGDFSKLDKIAGCDKETFSKYIFSIVKNIEVEECDRERYDDMCNRLDNSVLSFLPKQVDGDNRVIPYQLYYIELKKILENASAYLPFLNERDEEDYIIKEKIMSVMKFRVPYYVGPLNSREFGWIKRKADGKIYPWNFKEKVDLDASEQEFINRMTNTCSYLPGEDVLPKHSLIYEKFEVLNEINNLKIMDRKIPVKVKQEIYNELFCKEKRVTVKKIKDFLIKNNYMSKEDAETLSGIDVSVKSSLSSHYVFKRLLDRGILSETDVERIIERSTYSESKPRFRRWLNANFTKISEDDQKYIASNSFKDFGRLSRKLLQEFVGINKETGEAASVIEFMWNSNVNLSELLLGDKYTFRENLSEYAKEYYASNHKSIEDSLNDMYISNSVKRPIMRTLDIVKDVKKVMGREPEKIFIEMARGASKDQKGKRTKSRREQILEWYKVIADEDVKRLTEELEKMGDGADSKLQSESLFLYYMQLGKCMYSGERIDISKLSDGTYNIDHIYPQSRVSDDSLMNNKVLVKSELNRAKGDSYPIDKSIRSSMYAFWKSLLNNNMITDEKFKRLVRSTPFTDDEKWGFINRQLVETRQSTKALAAILKEMYPNTEIVYVKANLTAEFRHEFGLEKSRLVNDLHHAKDAYLNIVCGNVHNGTFTQKWFAAHKDSDYSIKPKTFYTRKHLNGDKCIWDGIRSLEAVEKMMQNNVVHMTNYAFCRHGGLFDQMPLRASEGLIPRKAGLPAEKYGGYKKPTVTYFILAKYKSGKKYELMLVPVELMYAKKIEKNKEYLVEYVADRIMRINGKKAEEISFPVGRRPIKINTLFSFDGFICSLAGTSGGGKCVIMAPFMPLILTMEKEQYIKKLEKFCEKCKNNSKYLYNEKYDCVSQEENIELYDILADKYKTTIYSKRPNPPVKILEDGRDCFLGIGIKEQAAVLLNIIASFGRISGGCDLTAVGGGAHSAATVNVSSSLSNWKKLYNSVYIIDRSTSGLYESRSIDLMGIL